MCRRTFQGERKVNRQRELEVVYTRYDGCRRQDGMDPDGKVATGMRSAGSHGKLSSRVPSARNADAGHGGPTGAKT